MLIVKTLSFDRHMSINLPSYPEYQDIIRCKYKERVLADRKKEEKEIIKRQDELDQNTYFHNINIVILYVIVIVLIIATSVTLYLVCKCPDNNGKNNF